MPIPVWKAVSIPFVIEPSHTTPTPRTDTISPWPPLLIGLLFLVLYVRTTAPGIVEFFDDSLEFQVVLPTLGVAHPTGYPLYTLLGALWSRVLFPAGEWAWRVNLLSALSAATAVGLVAATAQHVVVVARAQGERTNGRRGSGVLARAAASPAWAGASPAWAGAAAAMTFGLGPAWSSVATVAEVYALHNLFAALILWLCLRATAAPPVSRNRWLIGLALATGLGLAHHRTTVLLIPAAAVYLLWSLPVLRRPSRLWLWLLLAAVLPLLLYLYLPLRAAMGVRDLNGAYVNTVGGFFDHVLARRYAAFFSANSMAVARTWQNWLALAVSQTGWVALALAVLGVVTGFAHAGAGRRAWTLILLAGATNLIFALNYRVGDVEVFLLPVWLCTAVAAGGGVEWLRAALERRPALAVAASGLCLVLLAGGWDGRAALVNRRGEWSAQDLALAMTDANFPAGSRVIGLEGEMTAIRYMQAAQGRATGVETVVADDEALRRQRLGEAMAAGAPVYLTRELSGIAGEFSFGGEGALVRVWPRGAMEEVAPSHALDVPLADGALRLAGYDWAPLVGAEGRTTQLALFWEPQQPLTQTLKVSLRLQNADGSPYPLANGTPFQQDSFPVRGIAPTTAWLAGETVRDVYLLPEVTGGLLDIVVYDAASGAEVGRVQLPTGP